MPAVDVDVEALILRARLIFFFFSLGPKFPINSLARLCLSKNSHSKTFKKGS